MNFRLEPLPYETNALEPYIGARTVELHYHQHHAGYIEKLRKAVEGTDWRRSSLEEIVREAEDGDVFRNAAQTWNHTFYWKSMTPPGQSHEPGAATVAAIEAAFGDFGEFRERLSAAATGQFGSGWAWLVVDENGALDVTSTSNADNPMRQAQTPLLTLDVWEHAYYLDYQNQRARYVQSFVEELINWRFVERNLQGWQKSDRE